MGLAFPRESAQLDGVEAHPREWHLSKGGGLCSLGRRRHVCGMEVQSDLGLNICGVQTSARVHN